MTRIALIGYGAMGQAIERNAAAAGCEIVCVYDINSPLTPDSPKDFDVAIEFTQPDAVVSNVEVLASLRKHAVIGTTGWHGSLQTVRERADAAGIGLIYGANFSVGVQMFFQLVRAAAVLADRDDTMDVMLHEWHHKRKKDSPSGTAIAAAQIVLEELSRKTQIATDRMETPIEPNMLHVSSTRGGEIVGTHQLTLDGPTDTIELVHRAKDRASFALGALYAARWIHGRRGVYDFTDVFTDVMGFVHTNGGR